MSEQGQGITASRRGSWRLRRGTDRTARRAGGHTVIFTQPPTTTRRWVGACFSSHSPGVRNKRDTQLVYAASEVTDLLYAANAALVRVLPLAFKCIPSGTLSWPFAVFCSPAAPFRFSQQVPARPRPWQKRSVSGSPPADCCAPMGSRPRYRLCPERGT